MAMLSGKIGSGGSVKNWYTEIDKGTVMMMRNFPVAWTEQLRKDSNVEVIEIVEAATVPTPAATPDEATQLALQAIRTAGLDADPAAILAAVRAI
ncbi:hypothetical protein [Deinococcus altitudinis]|uniref:hypothetical protein n=1 Tax=Deinococcus altitudinis TaxID=468914 RepID=UPI0038926194